MRVDHSENGRGADQIQMITILETVVQPDDPFRSTGGIDKRNFNIYPVRHGRALPDIFVAYH